MRARAVARLLAPLAALLATAGHASAQSCPRPTDAAGFGGYVYAPATAVSFDSTNVRVWYVTTGAHAVVTTSTRPDGVPDDVALVSQYVESALASYAQMGYRAPVSDGNETCGTYGGDGRLDVYLVDFTGADGQTVTEECTQTGSALQCASFILAKAQFEQTYPSAETGVRTVLPHETFHTVQNAYDASIGRFWAEGTAQWAAKTLDPSLTDLESFLPAFFSNTSQSLDSTGGAVTSDFLYAAAIWPVFLTQRHTGGIVRTIFEQEAVAGAVALDATNTVLAQGGGSLGAEFTTFSVWNAATGARAEAGQGYADAAKYPQVKLLALPSQGAGGVLSGLAAYFYTVSVTAPMTVSLQADASRVAGTLVALVNGQAQIENATPLPADATGDAIVVVNTLTTNKTDAPFSLSMAAAVADAGAGGAGDAGAGAPAAGVGAGGGAGGGGCAIARGAGTGSSTLGLLGCVAIAMVVRRRRAAPTS